MSIKIAITVGDPGGIGPDICVLMAEKYIKKYHVVETKDAIKFPYYNSDNTRLGYKTRSKSEKKFGYEGSSKNALLFGQNLFNKGAKSLLL